MPSLLLSLVAFLVGNRFGTSVPQATVLILINKEFCHALDPTELNAAGANAEDLSDALMEAELPFLSLFGIPTIRASVEPLPGETRLWGDTDVIGLFDAETDMNDVVAILENQPLLGAGFAHKIEQLEDKDWGADGWTISPMRFGERLWICPSWRDVPDENMRQRDVRSRAGVWYWYPSNHLSVPAMARQYRFNR